MTYDQFRKQTQDALRKHPKGLTWRELKKEADLPYNQPCYEWIARLEVDIGLERKEKRRNALIWRLEIAP